jgi:hypothetical protein
LPDVFPAAVLSRALLRPFIPPTPRLAIDSYWRAHPTGWRGRSRRAAVSRKVGRGNSARRRAAGPPPSGSRPRLIAKRLLRAARASAACAASQSINSAGMSICGARAGTSARAGMAPASLPGSSGMRQASRRRCYGGCRRAAAATRAAAFGKTRRSITACRFTGSGASIALPRGPTCSATGVCRICKSSIATRTFSNAPTKPATAAHGARNWLGRPRRERAQTVDHLPELVAGARNSHHHRLPLLVITVRLAERRASAPRGA